jgi:hypothetical protein
MALQHFFERDSPLFPVLNALQCAFSEINVFQVLEVLQDGFAHIETLGAPGAPGQPRKSFFDRGREPNGKHMHLAIQV